MVSNWLAGRIKGAGETLNFLCGAERGVLSIYSAVFLILFTAKIWGVLDWPWWAIFALLVAAPLIHPLWWAVLLLADLLAAILREPVRVLERWAGRARER